MRFYIRIIFIIILTTTANYCFSQEKIDKSKEELKKGGKRESAQTEQSSKTSTSSSASSTSSGCSFANELGVGVFKVIFGAIYYSVIGNYETEKHLYSRVTKYPFYNKRSGNYESTDSGDYSKNRFRIDIDNGFLYSNKSLMGNHFKFNLRPVQYFYLQAQYHQLTEQNVFNKKYSNLSLFNFNFCYDRLRLEKFDLGWKLGVCSVANGVNKAGFSFGLNADIFLIKPISISVSKQWGNINGVRVNQFELNGKFHTKRCSINAGYEHFKIGSPVYDFISVGGGLYL
jgi:hypothetical protein